ncbi:MAG: flagellar basal body-associated FliL family protein [Bacillota bacterium]
MTRHRLFYIALILILAIVLLFGVWFVLWWTTQQLKAQPLSGQAHSGESAEELLERTVDTPEIVTNLYSGNFIRIQFKLVLDSEETREELEKRMFQVEHTAIALLSSLTPDDIRGEQGLRNVEERLKARVNALLQTGKVERVITTKKMVQ